MCGLKLLLLLLTIGLLLVTPHVGVWIETWTYTKREDYVNVTPHVGVWIETGIDWYKFTPEYVTPHVGVWIETSLLVSRGCSEMSHLM